VHRRPLLVGTGNKGKAAEIAHALEGLPWDIKTLADFPRVPEPVEDGDSFEANAIKKAAYYAQCFNVACLADDSGLMVDALNGEPGIYSARYSGDNATDASNNEKLLHALAGVEAPDRTARFVCCIAMVKPGTEPHIEKGIVEGTIGSEPRGQMGFGYDPLFFPDGFQTTFGEMTASEKLGISHRGRALEKLRAHLAAQRTH